VQKSHEFLLKFAASLVEADGIFVALRAGPEIGLKGLLAFLALKMAPNSTATYCR